MALSDAQLERIGAFLLADAMPANLPAFRAEFPGVTLTRCDARDMGGETPFRSSPRFDLYLLDAREHCVHITSDPACATGVVLARRA